MNHQLHNGHTCEPKDLPFAGNPITTHEELMEHYFVHPSSSTSAPEGPMHTEGDDLEHYMG